MDIYISDSPRRSTDKSSKGYWELLNAIRWTEELGSKYNNDTFDKYRLPVDLRWLQF